MKKSIILILSIVLIMSTIFMFACSPVTSNAYDGYDNLLNTINATIYNSNNSKIAKPSIKGEKEDFILIEFNEETEFDTIVLHENKSNVTLFSIETGSSKDSLKQVYQNDTIGELRVAYLGKTKSKYVKIKVDEFSSKYNIKDIEIFNIGTKKGEFRSVGYLIINHVDKDYDFSSFEALTHVIVFNFAIFNGSDIVIKETEEDSKQDLLDTQKLIKSKCDEYGVEMIIDIAMNPIVEGATDTGPMQTFDTNRDKTIANIAKFLPEYGFDGVDFDWEYPYSAKETNAYNKFLVELDKKIPDHSISIAYGAWQRNLSKEAKEAIDRVEVMSYDLFDERNYHATFEAIVKDMNKMVSKGFDKKKLDIGLPFYGRPLDRSAKWPGYADVYETLGHFGNIATFNDKGDKAYFNCTQMISDKTAFTIDAGFGGVMIWSVTYDIDYHNEYSLFAALHKTITSKLN